MIKKLILFILTFICAYPAVCQNDIKCEYWIDDDYAYRETKNGLSEEQDFTIDLSKYPQGMHAFYYRNISTDGKYGTIYRSMFYIPEYDNTKQATQCEYWIDDNYAERVKCPIMSEEQDFTIDLSKYTQGIHTFYYRTINTDGKYGTINRRMFYIPEAETQEQATRCEYWIDDDYDSRITCPILDEEQEYTLDVAACKQGIHMFNYRTIGVNGTYGILNRHIFYVSDGFTSEESNIVGYRYGFNGVFKYVKLPETKEYEMKDATFQLPNITDIATIGSNCNFTFNASTDEVKMQRSTDVTFSLQFESSESEWSASEIYNYQEEDEITHTAQNVALQKSIELTKVQRGDFAILKLVAPKAGTYYLRANQCCSIDIYTATGTKRSSLKEQQLINTASVSLGEGTYYAIVYNMVTDADNTENSIKIRYMQTNNIVPVPEISFADGLVTIKELQEEATIYYTTDGSEPSINSNIYSAPFSMLQNGTVKAYAICEGYTDSDVATYKINSYKTADPDIVFTNLKVYITCKTAESQVYYTTDGSSPLTNGILYSAPISVTGNCIVKAVAKRNGYNDSEVIEYKIDVSSVKCITPVLTIDGNLLTMTTLTEGATIYYTTNGSTPTVKSERYISPIVLNRNATYKAIAVKSGEIQSDMAEVVVDWFQAELPEMSFTDGKLTITCSTPNAIIYYTIGGETPTVSSTRYTQPIVLTDNRAVKAFAIADGFNPSDIVTYTPNMFTCASPEISFDGHAITVSCKTAGAKIFYTINGANPTEQSTVYAGTTVLEGLCTVKAIAMMDDMNNSSVVTYTLPCYYNNGDVYMHTAGTLERAFEWCGLPKSNKMTVKGPMNDSDFATIRKLSSLEYLNLSAVTSSSIADEALANMNLIYISMPSSKFTCGSKILKGCKRIAAIDWNSLSQVPDDILDGMNLPNMLMYVRNASSVSTKFSNVIIGSIAEKIELSDAEGSNFYCPREFTARNISYKHTYSQKTIKGVCTGWESIALPFSPTNIKHSVNGAMAPFAAKDSYKKPFWLCTLTEYGFESATKIEANTPYIIAMPNSDIYSDEYILTGEVTFSGNNVNVLSSTTLNYGSKGNIIFTPNFINKAKNTCMTLNVGEEYTGHLQGSLFVHDYRDAKPFEAYISVPDMMYASKVFFIDDVITGIEDIESNSNLQIDLVGNTIVINGLSLSGIVELYNISGQKLASVKGNGNKTMIDCSSYKNQIIVIRVINNKKEIKTLKFNL